MKTSNRMKKAELIKKVIVPKPGIAQASGFTNRQTYRNNIYKEARKTRNTSKMQTPSYLIMGGARFSGSPCPPASKRKKFKGWQRNLQNAR